MKICLVTNNLNPGAGLGRMVSNIAKELEERGHEVGFILGSGTTNSDFVTVSFGSRTQGFLAFFKDLLKARRFIAKYDYVVCYDVRPAGIIAFLATIGRKNNIIVHCLGTYSLFLPDSLIKNFLMAQVYKSAYRIFLINEFVKSKILESNKNFSFSKNQKFVPVGVETKNFLRKLEGGPIVEGEYIISVGAIKPRKGQLMVLKAFKKVLVTYPNLKYVVVGSTKDSPDYYEEMVKCIAQENLSESVIFIEDITDDRLINLYTYALFFILTPISTNRFIEGFGMVYIESALCGKTSIGTFDTGAEAAIEHMKTGILTDSTELSISEAMQKILSDSDLRKELEGNAYTRALTFDWKNVVDLYEAEFLI